jgi:hypothetical protein
MNTQTVKPSIVISIIQNNLREQKRGVDLSLKVSMLRQIWLQNIQQKSCCLADQIPLKNNNNNIRKNKMASRYKGTFLHIFELFCA